MTVDSLNPDESLQAAGATRHHAPRTFGRLRLRRLCEVLNAPRRTYLLKGLIAPAELSVVWGPPKCGKSFLVMRLVFGLALGKGTWGGAKAARILYIAAEGEGGIEARLRALHDELGDPGDAFQLITQRAVIGRPSIDLPSVVEAAKAMQAQMIVIDTLARTYGEGDENSATDMGGFVGAVDTIREETGAHVLVIHHGARNGANSRGSSALDGAADTIIKIERGDKDAPHAAIVTACKDDADGAAMYFALRVVDLGEDEDGDPRRTCIAEEADVPAEGGQKRANLGTNEQLVMQAYDRLGGGRLEVTALLDDVVQRMAPPVVGQRDRRRDVARRALDSLGAKQRLFVSAEYVADREPDTRARSD